MKRLVLVAAVIALAACATERDDSAIDTNDPAMAPAPADTGMMMDDSMMMDTTDTTNMTP
ncbi:MAG: hypothetical protein ACRENI_09765 [Gemmatimonadaceae bacterium]